VKAALIPPKGYFDTALRSDYHLALAQIDDPTYKAVYSNLPEDHHLILDNGAAEGQPVPTEHLAVMSTLYAANEIVAPDVIGDSTETLRLTQQFWRYSPALQIEQTMMIVLQGRSLHEVCEMADKVMETYPSAVMGIPRHLLQTCNDVLARCRVLRHIARTTTEQPVHLLGTSPLWAKEIRVVSEDFSWVRGVDTSMPYNFTIHKLSLARDAETCQVARPIGYFEKDWQLDPVLLEANINTYLEWASGTEGARS
jgi:hypothetical protein